MNDRMPTIEKRIRDASRAAGNRLDAFEMQDISGARPRRWLPLLIYTVAGLVLLAITGLVFLAITGVGLYQFPIVAETFAQTTTNQNAPDTGKQKAKSQPAPKQQQSAQPAPAATAEAAAASDPFLAQATNAGAKTCAATYANLGKVLTGGTQFMVQLLAAGHDVDRHAIQGVVGMNFRSAKDYSGPAAGIVFAAPTAKGCEGSMVRVVPFPQNCEATAALLPQGSKPLQPLSGLAVYALAAGGQAILLPAGNGCVVLSIASGGN